MTRRGTNSASWKPILGTAEKLGLPLGVGLRQEQQQYADDGEHAEGCVLTIPHLRLPHQEPLPANAQKGDQPHQERGCERRNSDALGLIERGCGASQSSRQIQSAPPTENQRNGFPGDDRGIKESVPRRANSVPATFRGCRER